ncbi:Pentatricopeptide repeat (PPR-like) superfamily protein [Euphorbia peplus]|nr:Pentatricopeptide repeat (PPR-like) superfamily protein [Euphorbia peplus]
MFSALWSCGDRYRALWMILEMLTQGINLDEITDNSLLSCLGRDGMVDEAIGLLVDMQNCRFQPNVVSYNIILLGSCKAQRVNDRIEVLDGMIEKGCHPNKTTYTLIEGIGLSGFRTEAMDLASSLLRLNAISEDSFKRLNKVFSSLDVFKNLISLDANG